MKFIFLMPTDIVILGLQDQSVFYTTEARMRNMWFNVILFGLFVFSFNFISGRKHLLGTLLRLEGIILIFFGVFCFIAATVANFYFYLLVFLVFVACEGALGLSLLVVVTRWRGGDRLLSLSLLQDS